MGLSSCSVAPPLPVQGGGAQSPVQAPVQGGGGVQSPMQVPMQPSSVQGASGGGALVQPQAAPTAQQQGMQPVVQPSATVPLNNNATPLQPVTAGSTTATTTAGGMVDPNATAAQAQGQGTDPSAVAGATGGGATAPDLGAIVPVLEQLASTLTQLVQALQGQGQAQAGAGSVQGGGNTAAAPATAAGGCGMPGCGGAADAAAAGVATGGGDVGAAEPAAAEPAPAAEAPAEPAPAEPAPDPAAANLPPKDSKSEEEIRAYIKVAAEKYGADPQVLDNIAKLESTYDAGRRQTGETVVNNWDRNAAAGHPSEGLMQFIPSTFESMSKEAKAANPEAWEGLGDFDIKDWRQQALTTAWAITNGKGSHWATFDEAGG